MANGRCHWSEAHHWLWTAPQLLLGSSRILAICIVQVHFDIDIICSRFFMVECDVTPSTAQSMPWVADFNIMFFFK